MKFISMLFICKKLNVLLLIEMRHQFHWFKFIEINHLILEEVEHLYARPLIL